MTTLCTAISKTHSELYKFRPPIRLGLAAPAILLVEHSAQSQQNHSHLLKLLDCKVDLARSANEALSLSHHSYDLILIDTCMPDFCGFELSELIKHRQGFIRVPIIALVHPDTQIKQGKMDEIVTKPLTKEKLIHLLSRWVP